MSLFALAAHHRSGLIYPILPTAALLAGREASRLLPTLTTRGLVRIALPVTAALLFFFGWYYHVNQAGGKRVAQTRTLEAFADELRARGCRGEDLHHVETHYALQFYLNTLNPLITVDEDRGRTLLAGPDPAYVAVGGMTAEAYAALTKDLVLHELAHGPAKGPPLAVILSNRPSFLLAPKDP